MIKLIVYFSDSKTRLTKWINRPNESPFIISDCPPSASSTLVFPPIGGTFQGFPLNDQGATFDFKVIDFVQGFGKVNLIVEIIAINQGSTAMKNGSDSWYQGILKRNGFV